MLSIGEFSVVAKLSVKTLRFYHEQGILVPERVDPSSSYRYYGERSVARAETIKLLRELEFGVSEIAEILAGHDDDAELAPVLSRKREEILAQIGRLEGALEKIDFGLKAAARGRGARACAAVEEKRVEDILFAGHRYTGKYEEIGKALGLVGGAVGRYICGPAMSLDHEGEYKDENADIEAGFPVKRGTSKPGVEVRKLMGGKAVTIAHRGPYETLGRSYELVFRHIHEKGYTALTPCRVLYHKGPGMVFAGNPEKYVTEIQVFVE